MSRRPAPAIVAVVGLVAGAAVLFLADAEWLRVTAATVMVAGIAFGVFAIATPEALAAEPPPEERDEG
ncbi:MAG TPA: hypothetical protein VK919_01435 [Solirubrobacterales bacterium]|nr:hypothetical protein [Solirubrobacterales bacterium]